MVCERHCASIQLPGAGAVQPPHVAVAGLTSVPCGSLRAQAQNRRLTLEDLEDSWDRGIPRINTLFQVCAGFYSSINFTSAALQLSHMSLCPLRLRRTAPGNAQRCRQLRSSAVSLLSVTPCEQHQQQS